jgi:alkane 1-monooxygenase
MNNCVYEIPGPGLIRYTDRKRYLWLLSTLFPLIPLVGIGLVLWTGRQWMLWLPLAFVYVVIPLLDWLFPNDRSNPPEELVPRLEADAYYRLLNHLTVPALRRTVAGAWFVATRVLAGARCWRTA